MVLNSVLRAQGAVQGLCVSAPCGGSNIGIKSAPWGSDACGVVTPTWYTNDTSHSPINPETMCLYFHNLITETDGVKHCEPCGTPGNRCIEECIISIGFHPIGSAEKGLGEFQFLDDSIRTSGPLVRPLPSQLCKRTYMFYLQSADTI